jgi:hypothetical protein
LLARGGADRRVIGGIDDILADDNEIAANREVVDGAAIILGVDDGCCFSRETGEILRHRHAAKILFAEKSF